MERLNARQLSYLTTLDHDRQEAFAASDAATGVAVAVARYAAIVDDPGAAEIAIAVSDPWQRRGLGTMLLNCLAERGRDHAIRRFSGLMLADNTAIQKLMTSIGPVISRTAHGGTVELVVSPAEAVRVISTVSDGILLAREGWCCDAGCVRSGSLGRS